MRRLFAVAVATALLVTVPVISSRATEPYPIARAKVEGPIDSPMGPESVRGYPWNDLSYEVDSIGYTFTEYFVSGVAHSFTTGAADMPYKTRIYVIRPKAGTGFSGTTFLEWDNVTAQAAYAPVWDWTHTYVLGQRHAFVYSSVQSAAVCCGPLSHQAWDPLRYQSLHHPGDDYSFDIYSQIGRVLRDPDPNGIDPMGGIGTHTQRRSASPAKTRRPFRPSTQRLVAVGQSQSASRLKTFIDSVQPQITPIFDAFLVDAGGSKTFATEPDVPVIHLLSEDGLKPADPKFPSGAATSPNYRLWEVPAASHNDSTTSEHRPANDHGTIPVPKKPYSEEQALHRDHLHYGEEGPSPSLTCSPIVLRSGNEYPRRYVVSAALDALHRWLADGVPAPQPPRAAFDATGMIARDGYGNALGGIRLPPIEVPVAEYKATTCALFGITVPFNPVTLRTLYPTHQSYVDAMQVATDAAVAARVLLADDAAELMGKAARSLIPDWPPPESPLS